MNNVTINACSVCWGTGRTIDGKHCPCGCVPNTSSASKPEDYGLPSYQQLQEQIATLTRQRDLAVEALEWAADVLPPNDPGEFGGCDCPVCRALEAIKESEAK